MTVFQTKTKVGKTFMKYKWFVQGVILCHIGKNPYLSMYKRYFTMKRILLFACLLLPFFACNQPKEDLNARVLELCEYIPDHALNPEAQAFMTPEFYEALAEAFDAPVDDYGGIGDNEWLWYFVTGNGGSTPVYGVKSVSKPSKNLATAIITVRDDWDGQVSPEVDAREYKIVMKRVDGKWLLDDFDGKKEACIAYVKDMRAKYASGEIIKYLEADEDLREYADDFRERVEAFYRKYGK